MIVVTGFTLRFWGIWGSDVSHDLAINSYRALGWLDYLGDKQTSPINWFSTLPQWTRLSFHDHPPLVFFIQHLIFRLLGESSLSAHLPFIIGGSLTIILVYLIVAKTRTPAAGLIAAGLYAVSSFAVWESRSGYLEGVEQVFIVAAVFFLTQLCVAAMPRPYYPLALGAALGGALLSKYTSVFLLPVVIISLGAWNRQLWKTRGFWFGAVLLVAALTPLMVYNVMIYASRGHFDAALSSMLGMHPPDFGGIARRGVNLNIADNISSIIRILWHSSAMPFSLFLAAALGVSVERVLRRRADRLTQIILLAIAGIVALFAFSGASDRFLSIIVPFLCVNGAVVWWDAWTRFTAAGWRRALILTLVITIGVESAFAINTNLLPRPWGKGGVTFSSARWESRGYEPLDRYLREQALFLPGRPKQINKLSQIVLAVHFRNARVVVIDDRIDWFAQMWYVRRYQHYYGANMIDLSAFLKLWRTEDPNRGALDFLAGEQAKELWLVQALNPPSSAERGDEYAQWIKNFGALLEQNGAETVNITTATGQDAFKVYRLVFRLEPRFE